MTVTTTRLAGSGAPLITSRSRPLRVLDQAAIRRELPAPPSHARWWLRFTTFDMHGPKELPVTFMDQRGLRAAEVALLAPAPGGSSNLGPSLNAVESAGFDGRRLLVVASDLELLDANPTKVLNELVDSAADAVMALVFRSAPPPALAGEDVTVWRVDPISGTPADIADRIVNFARSALDTRPAPVKAEDVLLDILDDESGSMWSGNDALCLRHEAALIAVEHLASANARSSRSAGRR